MKGIVLYCVKLLNFFSSLADTVKDEYKDQLQDAVTKRNTYESDGSLLYLSFTTVFEYLWLLKTTAEVSPPPR